MVRFHMGFTKYGINCYIPKKNILFSGHPSKKCLFGIATWEFPDPGGRDIFFKLKVYIFSLLKIGKKQKCP